MFKSGPEWDKTCIACPEVVCFQQMKTVVIGDSSVFADTYTIVQDHKHNLVKHKTQNLNSMAVRKVAVTGNKLTSTAT